MKRMLFIIMTAFSASYAMEQVSIPDFNKFPVHYAAAIGDLTTLKTFLEHEKALTYLTTPDTMGRLPLHWAAVKGNNHTVSYIVMIVGSCLNSNYAINDPRVITIINQKDNDGKTAAQLADEMEHESIVENLNYSLSDVPTINNSGNIQQAQPDILISTQPENKITVITDSKNDESSTQSKSCSLCFCKELKNILRDH